MKKEIEKVCQSAEALCWTGDEIKEFNRTHNSPFGEDYAQGEDNLLVSKNIFLSWNDSMARRRSDILVLGSTASGKTSCVILPNLMHASGSYVVADPSGELLKRSRAALRQKGYAIRVLDFANPAASDGYNPLLYSVDAEDTLNLTRCLLENTEPGNKVNDPFWEKSETALFNAVFAFLVRRRQGEKCTLHEAHRLVSIAAERGGEFDALFEEARKRKPNDPAVLSYDVFRLVPEKTTKAVCASAAERLAAFNGKPLEDISYCDTIALDELGDAKTALFLTGFHAAEKQKVLIPMLIAQLFNTLVYHAAFEYDEGELKEHVTLLLDEFPNIGYVPELSSRLACGTAWISVVMAAQSVEQIKRLYHKQTETILASCEAVVYMGGSCQAADENTRNWIKNKLGSATITETESQSSDPEEENARTAHESAPKLVLQEGICQIPDDMCLVCMKGMPATLDEKFCGYLE